MEAKTELFKIPYGEDCRHCRNNPDAEKPFIKMKRFPKDAFSKRIIKKLNEHYHVREECAVCVAMKELFNQFKETEELQA